MFSAFESRSKRRPPSLPWLGGLGGDTRGSWHRRQSKILEKHLVMPRYTRWAGHGVVSCVSLSSSFPARPSPVAFLVRPPSPTLCSSRSPPPTVAPSLRRSNHHVIQIWQARNSNLAGANTTRCFTTSSLWQFRGEKRRRGVASISTRRRAGTTYRTARCHACCHCHAWS